MNKSAKEEMGWSLRDIHLLQDYCYGVNLKRNEFCEKCQTLSKEELFEFLKANSPTVRKGNFLGIEDLFVRAVEFEIEDRQKFNAKFFRNSKRDDDN